MAQTRSKRLIAHGSEPAAPRLRGRAGRPAGRSRGLIRSLCQILKDRRGMMLVELAIAIPFIAALALGAAEVGRYLLLNQSRRRQTPTAN